MSEYNTHLAVVQYLKLQYKNALFHSDVSAVKLPIQVAAKVNRLNNRSGHPDLMIYERSGKYIGLAIEIKREGQYPYKKDGTLKKNEHLEKQQKYLNDLEKRGWKAVFCTGFDEAKKVIDWYLLKLYNVGGSFLCFL